MLEIEFKNLLEPAEYYHLLKHFQIRPDQIRTQTNIYFDTPQGHLKKARSALRVRRSASGLELTLKRPHPQGALEDNHPLTEADVSALIDLKRFVEGAPKKQLLKMGVPLPELHIIAELTTHRAQFPYEGGTLFLDHSTYNGKEDFELEFEADDYDAGLQTFGNLLGRFNLPHRPAQPKIRRAMETS